MRALSPDVPIDTENIEREIVARDRELDNEFSKDLQLTAVRGARKYRGDKLIRVATPHRILDPKAGPLIAVKLHVLTRKSLGGIQTDLDSRALARRRLDRPGPVRGRRGGRLRRRRRARLPRARGHLPRRMPLHRPRGGAGDRPRLTGGPSSRARRDDAFEPTTP